MKLSIFEMAEIIIKMKNNNVVLYGAGNIGCMAVEILEELGIKVTAVADRETGKKLAGLETVDLEKLCSVSKGEVCIITFAGYSQDIKGKLGEFFDTVVDYYIIRWLKYFVPKDLELMLLGNNCFPFNHYESPYPSNEEINAYISAEYEELTGINLNIEVQKKFIFYLRKYYSDFLKLYKRNNNKVHYNPENGWFGIADALLLHSMIRVFKPNRIIEIGSGYSTSVMVDTNEFWMNNTVDITCVEPNPQRLFENLKHTENKMISIKKEFVQNVPLCEFKALNDILFIDSSHVVKAGGDIIQEYFNILPNLNKGVIIHIHDIFYPFTYPEQWVRSGRAYNEAYILRALLMNSDAYEILFFNNMMAKLCCNDYGSIWEDSSFSDKSGGGSIYLRKI